MSGEGLRGRLVTHEPMSRHTSWRAGGPAAHAYFPVDLDDLALFLASLRHDEPVLIVGLGSNLLVRDGGFTGTVIFTQGALNRLYPEPDGSIYVEAGVPGPKLARFAADAQLAGLEFLVGIPGTFGGALAMNAGCHGQDTWQFVERLLMLDRFGHKTVRTSDEFSIGYRHVGLKTATDELFAAAWLRLPPGDGAVSRRTMAQFLEKRRATQPLDLPNAGSIFRNPPNDHAARLIEAAGLKGMRCGEAEVSEKHANFIVNPRGKASASEIEMLICKIAATVLEKFGVELTREVRIVGATH